LSSAGSVDKPVVVISMLCASYSSMSECESGTPSADDSCEESLSSSQLDSSIDSVHSSSPSHVTHTDVEVSDICCFPHQLVTSSPRGVQSIVMSIEYVPLSACSLTYLENYAAELHIIFCACCLWPWFGPPLTSLWYIMYFPSIVNDVMFSHFAQWNVLV